MESELWDVHTINLNASPSSFYDPEQTQSHRRFPSARSPHNANLRTRKPAFYGSRMKNLAVLRNWRKKEWPRNRKYLLSSINSERYSPQHQFQSLPIPHFIAFEFNFSLSRPIVWNYVGSHFPRSFLKHEFTLQWKLLWLAFTFRSERSKTAHISLGGTYNCYSNQPQFCLKRDQNLIPHI